jgi:mannose-1-phosphate guanylyltransferase
MLEWLSRHEVDEVILSCGFMADAVRGVLGDVHGSGIRLRYLEEPRPLGTGGAVKFAQEWLAARFFVLNGDVLTDIDLTAQLRQHERTGATATLGLVTVEDPSAYGLVRCNPDKSISEFVEKPGPEEVRGGLINAGAYILEHDVLDAMGPQGKNHSIERDVFPALVDRGLFGYAASGYWLDIGTPPRYLEGTYDILEGNVNTDTSARLGDAGGALVEQARVDGRVVAPSFVGADAMVAAGAIVGGRTVLGPGVRIDEHAHVESSVLLDGASVGAHSAIRSSIIGPRVAIGERCHIEDRVVIGEGVRIGAGNVLTSGARIFPGVELPEGAIKF